MDELWLSTVVNAIPTAMAQSQAELEEIGNALCYSAASVTGASVGSCNPITGTHNFPFLLLLRTVCAVRFVCLLYIKK